MDVRGRSGGAAPRRTVIGRLEVATIRPLHNVSNLPSMMEAVKIAARDAAEREMPIGFYVLAREGWLGVTPFGRFGREDLAGALASCFDELGVTLYGGVAEVWVSAMALADDNMRPSKAPDRMELVLAGAADRLGNKRLGSYVIGRDGEGHRRLGPWEEARNRDIWWLKLIDLHRVLH
jgi:hypothetical protein